MYFPVADIEVTWYVPILVTFLISTIASMGGFSGAFLFLPFQVQILGYTAPSVSATNQFYNLFAIPSSLYQYVKEKRFYKPLCYDLAIGGIPGVLLGSYIRAFVLNSDSFFRVYVALILLLLSSKMFYDSFDSSLSKNKPKDITSLKDLGYIDGKIHFSFDGKEYSYVRKHMYIMACIVTCFGCIYGIGGGIFLAPFLLSYFRLPVYITAAAVMFSTYVACFLAVSLFYIFAYFQPAAGLMPDLKLAVMLAIGGSFGMVIGTKMQKFVSAQKINFLIIALLVITSFVTIKPVLDMYF